MSGFELEDEGSTPSPAAKSISQKGASIYSDEAEERYVSEVCVSGNL
jgi:hypothetical protein